MGMIDRIAESYNSRDTSGQKRLLSQGEIDGLVELVSKYFVDDENVLRQMLSEVVIIPKNLLGVPFFTNKEQVQTCRKELRDFPCYITNIEIEGIFAFISQVGFDNLADYVEMMQRRMDILQKIDPLGRTSYKEVLTKEDYESAIEHRDNLSDDWDREEDRSNGFVSARFEKIQDEYRVISEKVSFLEEYIKNQLDKDKILSFSELLKSSPCFQRELYSQEDIDEAQRYMYECDEHWSYELDRSHGYGYRSSNGDKNLDEAEQAYYDAEAIYKQMVEYRKAHPKKTVYTNTK